MLFALNSVLRSLRQTKLIHQPYPDEELFVTGSHVTGLKQGPFSLQGVGERTLGTRLKKQLSQGPQSKGENNCSACVCKPQN